MKISLKSIVKIDSNRYEVLLEDVEGSPICTFIFQVKTGSGIDVVASPPEFYKFMKCNMGPAAPLLETVLKFHQSQSMSLKLD